MPGQECAFLQSEPGHFLKKAALIDSGRAGHHSNLTIFFVSWYSGSAIVAKLDGRNLV